LIAQRANDVLHVLAGGAWLGALLPLIPILRLLDEPDCHADALLSLRRFSTAGHIAVALVLTSGVINTALILQRLPTDWSSPYQALLALKIILIAGMTGLAIVNRYIFVPRMRPRAFGERDPSRQHRRNRPRRRRNRPGRRLRHHGTCLTRSGDVFAQSRTCIRPTMP
jgi:putative copper export protein